MLTSTGISNRTIAAALKQLHGKQPGELKVGFVPIAANAEEGNKDWVIHHLLILWRHGYNWIDIIDPTAAGIDWKARLAQVDIIVLPGGNTFYLLDQARKTGFDKWLVRNLKNKIYVGGSASSILVTPTIAVAAVEPGDPNLPGIKDLRGLGFVDFEIMPHVPSSNVPGWISYEKVEAYSKTTLNKVYALDDTSAIKVDGKKVKVISEGSWEVFNS